MKNKSLIIAIIVIALVILVAVAVAVTTNSKDKNIATSGGTTTTRNEDSRTMEEFVESFKNAGYEINLEEKPYYTMIGASDGVIFYIDGSPVKIYKYDSEENYNNALNENTFIKDCDKNGLFVLETTNEKAKSIFNSIEK